MKKSLFLRKGGIVPFIVLLLFTAAVNAATVTSKPGGGPWNFTTTWVGGVAPVAGDDVVLVAGSPVELTANAVCKSLTLSSTTASSTLSLLGFQLDVTEAITIARPSTGGDFNIINVNAGVLNTASIHYSTTGGGAGFQYIYVTTGTLTVSGNVTGGTSGLSALNITGTGTVKLGGSLFTSLNGTLSAATGSTVEYNGAVAQNVSEFTYSNLKLSGAGVKTVSNLNSLPLANGLLSVATGTKVNVSNTNVPVSKISLGGFGKMAGIYGTTISGAAIANDTFFTVGSGTLNVASENRLATTTTTTTTATYTYTGLPQGHGVAVVTPAGAPAATFSYTGTAFDASTYGPSATKPTKAGNYTVVATVTANENYLGSTDTDASNIAKKALTITGFAVASKVYDDTNAATTSGTIVGIQNSEPTGVINVSFAGSTFDNELAATGKTVTPNLVMTGSGTDNYTLTQPTPLTTGVITKAVITVVNNSLTPIVVADQVYNGLLPVTGSITGGSLTGVQGGDVVTVTYTGAYATKVVGMAKPVTVVTTLDVASAVNYTVVTPTNVTGNITPKALTVGGTIATTKAYDSSIAAVSTGGTLLGVVSPDVVTLTQTGSYDTNAVGTGKTVTHAMTIAGADAGNYTITQPSNTTNGVITKKLLGITASVTTKAYDGTTTAAVTGAVLTGVLPIDTVTLSGATTGTFDNKNFGTGKVVTVTGATLSGVDAGNYSLPSPFTLTGEITKKALTLSNATIPTVVTKVYDGTTVASIYAPAGFVGVIGSENVVLVGTPQDGFHGTGTFATKDVGTAKAVTSNSALTGADAANYTLTQPIGLTGDITKANLTITALSQIKCFGEVKNLGTTQFTLSPTATQNAEMVDSVILTSAGGLDANVSTPTGLYPLDIVPSGATGSAGFLASNYTITYVKGDFTVGVGSLVSAASSTPTLCVNTALTPITFSTSNATGIGTPTGLPAGVTAAWLANVITISGTPTASSATPFNYSIPLLGGCGPVMATGTITVNPTLTASVVIAATTPVCQGTAVTFTATPTNGGTTPVYQWYNGATAVGTNSATYSYTPAVANTDVITVKMTSNATPCLAGSPATSNAVTIVVNPTLTASVAVAASPAGAVCAGTTVTYTATPTNGGTTPTYQWYKGATAITGATSATYSYIPAIGNTDAINVKMTSNATPCLAGSPVTSASTTTTVSPTLVTPTVIYSSGVLVSSSATGNQWYTCAGVLIVGATGQTYTAPTAGSYKVVVTSGGCTATSACVNSWPLAVNGFDSKAFSFYPNPVNNELNLSYSKEITSVKVVNLVGQVVASQSANASSLTVDMSGLPAGVYLVEVVSGTETKTIKVVKN